MIFACVYGVLYSELFLQPPHLSMINFKSFSEDFLLLCCPASESIHVVVTYCWKGDDTNGYFYRVINRVGGGLREKLSLNN